MSKPVFVLFGKTGSGKTHIIDELHAISGLRRIRNTTTRPQRGDKDTEYNFESNSSFLRDNGRYVAVRKYTALLEGYPKDYYYGVDKHELEEGGLMITDFEGFKELCGRDLPLVGIYIHADENSRLRRSKERVGYVESEFIRRNEDDNRKFPLDEIIELGKTSSVYIVDNSDDVDVEDTIHNILGIMIHHK